MESTKLQLAQKPMNFNELARMSTAFAQSGLFKDITSAAMAMVKIQAGLEMGIKPFAAMSGIHIIQGKPTPGAGIIASRIKANPKYDYKIVEFTDEVCSIDFYENNEKSGNSSFTIADARRAQTQNLGKFPKNMLFARAISNGCKWYCPDTFDCAVYTEYEIEEEVLPVPQKETSANKELERFTTLVNNCTTIDQVKSFYKSAVTDEEKNICNTKAEEIDAAKVEQPEIIEKPVIDLINEAQTLAEIKKIAGLVSTESDRTAYDIKFKQIKSK